VKLVQHLWCPLALRTCLLPELTFPTTRQVDHLSVQFRMRLAYLGTAFLRPDCPRDAGRPAEERGCLEADSISGGSWDDVAVGEAGRGMDSV
jgi:hypothetical protein